MTDTTTVSAAQVGEAFGYDLLPSDPTRVDGIMVRRRLRTGPQQLSGSPKPLPFLGVAPGVPGQPPALVTVKIAKLPHNELSANSLREEEIWARAEGLFHSVGHDGEFAWVARAYLQGTAMNELDPNLADAVKRTYAEYLITEIERFHRAAEAHLDVKPSNVIITDSRAWLIDFESSRAADQVSALPLLATTSFASPEQAFPNTERRVSLPSDIFSWGLSVAALFRPNYHPYCDGPFDMETFKTVEESFSRGRIRMPQLDFIPDQNLRDAVLHALTWQASGRPTAVQIRTALRRDNPQTVAIPQTRLINPADFAVAEPTGNTVRRLLGPTGPFGDRRVPAKFVGAALGVSALLALLLTLVLRVLFALVVPG